MKNGANAEDRKERRNQTAKYFYIKLNTVHVKLSLSRF